MVTNHIIVSEAEWKKSFDFEFKCCSQSLSITVLRTLIFIF